MPVIIVYSYFWFPKLLNMNPFCDFNGVAFDFKKKVNVMSRKVISVEKRIYFNCSAVFYKFSIKDYYILIANINMAV